MLAINVYAYRQALCESHPVERWIHVGKEVCPGGIVSIGDAARDALDIAFQVCAAAHQADVDRVPDAHLRQLSLLEVAIDPVRMAVDQCQTGDTGARVVTDTSGEVGNITVNRRAYIGAVKIDLCGGLRYLRLGDCGLRLLLARACLLTSRLRPYPGGARGCCHRLGVGAVLGGDHFVQILTAL